MRDSTKQLRILFLLTELLEGISDLPSSELGTDGQPLMVTMAGRVWRGRTQFGNEQMTPFLTIIESRRPDNQPELAGYDGEFRNEIWHLLIQGFMDDDDTHPLDNLYRFKGEVEVRLSHLLATNEYGDPVYPAVYLCNRMVEKISIGPGVVAPFNATTGGTEAFYLPLVLTFANNIADP